MEQEKLILDQETQKEDVRNRILDVAEALFCERGFEGVSVRELTAAAGCNLAAVNYYFGGKDKLYAEMFRRQFEMMIQRNLGIIERTSSTLCNRNSKPFFPIIFQHLCDVGFRGLQEPLAGGKAARRVHAHVERAVVPEAEAALGVVELW